MKHSESIAKISAALIAAQAEFPVVKFNSKNPFLGNRYADLAAVKEASQPVLTKHGLAITQFPSSAPGEIGITTLLLHESGEWLEDTASIGLDNEKGKSAAQVAGSYITYLRRYAWAAILGLVAEEDNDGNHPDKTERRAQPAANTHRPPAQAAQPAQPAQAARPAQPAAQAPAQAAAQALQGAAQHASEPVAKQMQAEAQKLAAAGAGPYVPPPNAAQTYSPPPAQPAPPVEPETWDGKTIHELAEKWKQNGKHILAALNRCSLPKYSSTADLDNWLSIYRQHRDNDETVDQAAAAANKAF